jgi:predicted metal-dependent hydrolase
MVRNKLIKHSENKLLIKAARWYLKKYLADRKIHLTLSNVSKKDDKKYWGFCSRKNGQYTIKLTRPTAFASRESLATLFHELTHLNQLETGKVSPDFTRWCGEKYPNTRYRFRPWEIESHAVENILMDYFLSLEGLK